MELVKIENEQEYHLCHNIGQLNSNMEELVKLLESKITNTTKTAYKFEINEKDSMDIHGIAENMQKRTAMREGKASSDIIENFINFCMTTKDAYKTALEKINKKQKA